MTSKNKHSDQFSKIILGIDPGTQVMGFGLIGIKGKNAFHLIEYGCLSLGKYKSHPLKLQKIFEKVSSLIRHNLPDELAIEAPFYGKNVQAMLKLGRAQGVAIAAAIAWEIPVQEYAPKLVKQSVTGNGSASKEQVASMLGQLLNFSIEDNMLDATDALSVALCHYFQEQKPGKGKAKSWEQFMRDNPERFK